MRCPELGIIEMTALVFVQHETANEIGDFVVVGWPKLEQLRRYSRLKPIRQTEPIIPGYGIEYGKGKKHEQ